jgi:hypothetical protein
MKEVRFSYGGKDYITISPTARELTDAKAAYTMAFRKSIEAGAYLRKAFDQVLEDQGLWSAEKTKKISSLQFLLAKLERKLNSKIKLSEAKDVAKQLTKARNDLRELVYERTALDDRTSEGQAEQARLEYLCSVCTLDQITRKPVFASVLDMNDSDPDLVSVCLDKVAALVYEVDPDFESKLPEQKFFTRFGKPELEVTEEVKEFIEDIAKIETVGDVETIEYEDDITPIPEPETEPVLIISEEVEVESQV